MFGLNDDQVSQVVRKIQAHHAAIAKEAKIKGFLEAADKHPAGALVKDLVPGGASIATLAGKVYGWFRSANGFPLDEQEFFAFMGTVLELDDAKLRSGRFVSRDDLAILRALATGFFSDQAPSEHNRDRSQYFEELFAGNDRVFCFFTPFMEVGVDYPVGYSSVIPLRPPALAQFAAGNESQFSWHASVVATRSALESAAPQELADFGLYIQAVGVEQVLRDTAPEASSWACTIALLHLLSHLDGLPIATASELPRIIAEGTTNKGRRFMRRWPAVFNELGMSADGNPLFDMNRGFVFNLREGLRGRESRFLA